MQWPKAKNLIIILLLAVNIVLFVQLLTYNSSSKFITREFADSSAIALRDADLYIEKDKIPLEIPHIPAIVYSFSVTDYEGFVSKIFSKPIGELTSEIIVNDGSISGSYYESELGRFSLFFDGSFLYESSAEPYAKADAKAAENLALAFGALAGISERNLKADTVIASDFGYQVTVSQYLQGVPVQGYGMVVDTDGKNVKTAVGKLLLVKKDTLPEQSLGTVVDALFKLSESADGFLSVSKVTLCYYPVTDNRQGSFTATCTPAYRFDTNNGTMFCLLTSGQIYSEQGYTIDK